MTDSPRCDRLSSPDLASPCSGSQVLLDEQREPYALPLLRACVRPAASVHPQTHTARPGVLAAVCCVRGRLAFDSLLGEGRQGLRESG